MNDKKTIAVDLDGVLAEQGHWTDMATAQAIRFGVEECNRLYDMGHTVIIHTARLPEDYLLTRSWLVQNGVKFTALEMGKVRADAYIDDRNATFANFANTDIGDEDLVILYSGGLDSLLMARLAKQMRFKSIRAVYFDIGHGYSEHEKARLPPDVEVRKIDWLKGETSFEAKEGSKSGGIIIPGRNMVFATLAAAMFTPHQIWLGAMVGEDHAQSTDKNNEFRTKANALHRYVLEPFAKDDYSIGRVVFPFVEMGMNKLDAVRTALRLGWVTAEEVEATRSCLSETSVPCGACVACIRRWGIFRQVGLKEQYLTEVTETKMFKDMVEEMRHGKHYDENRKSEILPALETIT